MSTMSDILREARGYGDTGLTIAKNAAWQPVAGWRGIADLLRGKGLGGAVQGIEDTQALAGGPSTPEGARTLRDWGKWTEQAGNALGNPIDKLGEVPVVGPTLAAGALGFMDTANPGKGVKSATEAALRTAKRTPTVMRPKREPMFPDVYKDPRDLVAGAKVAPEDPAMQQLFGVNRADLFDIAQQGARAGNMTEQPFKSAAKGKGAAHAADVMNPRNTQRMVDIIAEARKRPDLFQGMASWYTMDPLYQQFERLYGPEKAAAEYARFNTLTGMASPGSEVLTEMNRGTAANWLDKEGRFGDFVKHGGGMTSDRPADMAKVMGHAYHKTAQAGPMAKYLREGVLDMGSAKVPSYIHASGVPETGFQTQYPVGDAHWSRLVGLPDVRGKAGGTTPISAGASASVPEMVSLSPWWRDKVAAPSGLEAVPAQAVVWGAGSNATGVTSPIGAPKLELLSQRIMDTSRRLGVSPETARDMVIMGKTHAGQATPEMLAAIAAGTGGAAVMSNLLREKKEEK
jgi:hypothetical protein